MLHLQGPLHRLEIGPHDSEQIIKVHDISTDDEERDHLHTRDYEQKIGHLMNEVGELKNEVDSYAHCFHLLKNRFILKIMLRF